MRKTFFALALFLLVAAAASAQTNYYTTDQIMNQVFDEPSKKLNVAASVSIGSLEVRIETPSEMVSTTVSIADGATTEVSFSSTVKSVLIQNFGSHDIKYIANRNTGTGLSVLQSGAGVAFDLALTKLYIFGSSGTSEIQIDAWK